MQEVRRILKHVIKELKLPIDVQDHVDEYGHELILNGAVGIRKEEGVYCKFYIPCGIYPHLAWEKGTKPWDVARDAVETMVIFAMKHLQEMEKAEEELVIDYFAGDS